MSSMVHELDREPTAGPKGLIGRVFGNSYQIVDLIGRGGMGYVYLATQLALARPVAIKIIDPDVSHNATMVRRFRREVWAVQRLSHPNTVRVYDFAQTSDGLHYLVMEYLDGISLSEMLARAGALSTDMVIEVGAQVLKSLMEAHGHSIIHRDIKPGNLMMCSQVGVANFVKVLDFGLALMQSEGSTNITQTRDFCGTPSYMSPEHLRGQTCDARSDLYSLGVTLCELATGKQLYTGTTSYEIAVQHLSNDEADLPEELNGSFLGDVIARALRKNPIERYPSAKVMLRALTGELLTGSKTALPALAIQELETHSFNGPAVEDRSEQKTRAEGSKVQKNSVQMTGQVTSKVKFRPEKESSDWFQSEPQLSGAALDDLEACNTAEEITVPDRFGRWRRARVVIWPAALVLVFGLVVAFLQLTPTGDRPAEASQTPQLVESPVELPLEPNTNGADNELPVEVQVVTATLDPLATSTDVEPPPVVEPIEVPEVEGSSDADHTGDVIEQAASESERRSSSDREARRQRRRERAERERETSEPVSEPSAESPEEPETVIPLF